MPDWEAMYQAQDTGWDRGESSPALQMWLQNKQLEQGRVLIPGCGRGYEVVELAKRGFEVTALDIAPSAITALQGLLQQNNSTATTLCADLFAYQTEEQFDIIYEQTCMCAIEPEQRNAYEMQLFGWLKQGGKLLFSMMQTGEVGGPPFHCDWSDMRKLFDDKRWFWQEEPPFVIPRGNKRVSARYELGFALQHR